MSEYTWPPELGFSVQEDIRRSWPATVSALPIGASVGGRVIGRQPFGVFIRIDGVPNALGLAEITAMPHEMDLPPVDAVVTGRVIWHADHNHQVKLRLDDWARP
ncbi:hypothetical protein OG896_16450 [Streptomyces sp. NBC_00669]|uniref:hypothetical protein n=1 Tax=Streptomyces sp. NBC_00669 TaxID=2976011 RepID=UPI002E334B12|nr:hypothetical protein [Streptomyces sp. NBC_00669]